MTPRIAATLAIALLTQAPTSAGAAEDPRSIALVRLECESDLGRREVTLFQNGTVRVREGAAGQEQLMLGEYGPDEVAAFRRRLDEIDFSETDAAESAPDGAWVERCRLELRDERLAEPRSFAFGRYGSHSLALSTAVRVVEDIAIRAGVESARPGLPADYKPEPGDRLERTDGQIFEIVGFTADGKGVELTGILQPLTLYLPISDLRQSFVRLERRRRPG